MKIWNRIKDGFLTNKVNGYIVTADNGYVFDRRIFYVCIAVILALGGWYIISHDVSPMQAYLHCPENAMGGKCDNPFYGTCKDEYCLMSTIPAGYTYGTPPDNFYINFGMYTIGLIVLSLFINHFVHNRKFNMKM